MKTDNERKACDGIFNYKHIYTHTYKQTHAHAKKHKLVHKCKKTHPRTNKPTYTKSYTHRQTDAHSYISSQHTISERWWTRTRNFLIFARVHVPVTLIMNYAITPQLALSPGVLAESLIASFIVRWLSVSTMEIALFIMFLFNWLAIH